MTRSSSIATRAGALAERVTGVVPIVAMPFDGDGELAPAELEAEVRWLVEEGVDGLGLAIASELFALRDEEWHQAVRTIVRSAAGSVPVIASVGQPTPEATLARVRAARAAGADATMAFPPGAAGGDLVGYYAASSGILPMWVQDAPQLTGVEIPLDRYEQLAASVTGICGFKVEAHPTAEKIAAARRSIGPEPVLLGGAGGFSLPDELAAGAEGTMPGTSSAAIFVAEWRAHRRGDFGAVCALHAAHREQWGFAQEHAKAFVHLQKLALVDRGVFSSDRCRFSPEVLGPEQSERWLALLRAGR